MNEEQLQSIMQRLNEEEFQSLTGNAMEAIQKEMEDAIIGGMAIPKEMMPRETAILTAANPGPPTSAQDVIDSMKMAMTALEAAKMPAAAPKYRTVICIDNLGIEDQFNLGEEYVSENADDPDFLVVYDRDGKRRECFLERFELKDEPIKVHWGAVRKSKNPIKLQITPPEGSLIVPPQRINTVTTTV